MNFSTWNAACPRWPISVTAGALIILLTVAAVWLWAHEGHQALPTRGASIDAAKGVVVLSEQAREALHVEVAEVAAQTLNEELVAPATIVAPWQRHAFVS